MDNELTARSVFGGDSFLEELLIELEAMYPPVNPTPKDSDKLIMFRAGQRSVVEYLNAKKNNV